MVTRFQMEQLHRKAEEALQQAVNKVVDAHWRAGLPLVVWQDGKVVHLPPDRIDAVRESPATYAPRRDTEES